MLLGETKFHEHAIELKNSQQLFFKLIYSLGLVKLETLKTYIKIHLKIVFIQLFKFFTNILILFNKMLNSSF